MSAGWAKGRQGDRRWRGPRLPPSAAGCRPPFARAGTSSRDLTAVDLAKACVRELIERSEIDPAAVDLVAMGQVIPSVKAPNLAREVVLGAGLPAAGPAPRGDPA